MNARQGVTEGDPISCYDNKAPVARAYLKARTKVLIIQRDLNRLTVGICGQGRFC